jgi:hypothetical protein
MRWTAAQADYLTIHHPLTHRAFGRCRASRRIKSRDAVSRRPAVSSAPSAPRPESPAKPFAGAAATVAVATAIAAVAAACACASTSMNDGSAEMWHNARSSWLTCACHRQCERGRHPTRHPRISYVRRASRGWAGGW